LFLGAKHPFIQQLLRFNQQDLVKELLLIALLLSAAVAGNADTIVNQPPSASGGLIISSWLGSGDGSFALPAPPGPCFTIATSAAPGMGVATSGPLFFRMIYS
jgi:hypothetical protein